VRSIDLRRLLTSAWECLAPADLKERQLRTNR
jgi:hypothetical protein